MLTERTNHLVLLCPPPLPFPLPCHAMQCNAQSRANCSLTTAKALYDAAESKFSKNGFAKDDGASLRRTMEGQWPGSSVSVVLLCTLCSSTSPRTS